MHLYGRTYFIGHRLHLHLLGWWHLLDQHRCSPELLPQLPCIHLALQTFQPVLNCFKAVCVETGDIFSNTHMNMKGTTSSNAIFGAKRLLYSAGCYN